MKVNHVKLSCLAKNQFHQPDMVRQRLATIRITPESALASGNESRRGFGVAASEQGDVVAQAHQLFSQVGNDALGPAVQFRRNALIERRYLCNTHNRSNSCFMISSDYRHAFWANRCGAFRNRQSRPELAITEWTP